jgi:hypothetical protein
MKKEHLLAILFFGGLWGFSEAVLGDALYSAGVPQASVYLGSIGLLLLAVASRFAPHRGAPTAIAFLAMLYKFLNVPFFACHLVGIALLGVSYDLVFGWRTRSGDASVAGSRPSFLAAGLKGALACYLSRTLFCLTMIFAFRSESWTDRGIEGVWEHVVVGGSLAAAASALAVPIGLALGRRLRERTPASAPPLIQPRLAGILTAVLTAGLWAVGMTAKWWRG